ncbi:MAG: flippase-like domain-containing protein [Deltaproteobacteria bacterium]|nr:flippase-like domain-containing protein [Deltaproteobacteria bacterium]
MKSTFKKSLPYFTFLISLLLLAFCFQEISWQEFRLSLQQISWKFLAFAFIPLLSLVFVKSLQWKCFSKEKREIPFSSLFEAISTWLMMVNLLPFWMGEAFLIYILGQRFQFGKTYSTSLLTLDQIFEGLSLMCIFSLLILAHQIPTWMQIPIHVFFIGIFFFYFLLLILAYRFRHSKRLLHEEMKLKNRMFQVFKNWASELSLLHRLGPTLFSLFFALCIKALEYFSLTLLQWGLGLTLPWWAPLLIIAGLNLALMIPMAPANLGVFEATVFYLYQNLGVHSGDCMVLALSYHGLYLAALVLPGYFVFVKRGFRLPGPNNVFN